MSGKVLFLEILAGDTTVAELALDGVRDNVMIGRAGTCDLVTPADDCSVSAKHARVFRRGRTYWIEDAGSRNGIMVDGVRIKAPVRLKPGAVCRLGTCYLAVSERTVMAEAPHRPYHRLEFLSGNRIGEFVDVCPSRETTGGVFLIGQDEASDIVLADRVISRRHAALSVRRNGDCFVRDLGSSNGTYVNGERLDARERFLRHGDKISIAFFEFRFHDRRAKPAPSAREMLNRIGILVIVAVVLTAGWLIYEGSRPVASHWREQAAQQAAQEDFKGALASVAKARDARRGKLERPQTDALAAKIAVWHDTATRWESVRARLAAGKTGTVRLDLENICSSPSKWTWNGTSAASLYAEATFARDLVRRVYAAVDRLSDKPLVRTRLEEEVNAILAFEKEHAGFLAMHPYLAALVRNLDGVKGQLQAVANSLAQIDRAIASFEAAPPDFATAEKILAQIIASKDARSLAAIRVQATELMPMCHAFKETGHFLAEEAAALAALDFAGVKRMADTLPLPKPDDCARQPAFSKAREVFKSRHEQIQDVARMLAPIVRDLAAAGVASGEPGDLVRSVCSLATWEKAFTFDCFTGSFPVASRREPNSAYDGLVGIESTYEQLRRLPKAPARHAALRMHFVPQALQVKMIFEQARTLRVILERPDIKAFRTGALDTLYALSGELLEMRDGLVSTLKARATPIKAGQTLDRAQLIAGLYAAYYAEKPTYADLRMLEDAFKSIEKRVRALNDSFDLENDPEKRLKLRSEIIATGIPGDAGVRQRWTELGD